MDASCKIIGDTIAETAYRSGRWGYSWGTRFLRDLETASNAVKGMEYIDDAKVRGYIANGVCKLVKDIFNKENANFKSVFEQYMETAKEYENEHFKVDDPICRLYEKNDFSYNKVTISLHEGKFFDASGNYDKDKQRLMVTQFYSYSNLFWSTINSKIDSCFTVKDFTDDIVIPKSVYDYLTLIIDRLGGHIDDYNVTSIGGMLNKLEPHISDIKQRESDSFDDNSLNVAIKFLEDMINHLSTFKHDISIKFVYSGTKRYREVFFRFRRKENNDKIADEGINLKTPSANV